MPPPAAQTTAFEHPLALVLLTAGVVAAAVLLTMSVRAKIARRNARRPSSRELIDRMKSARDRSGDVHAAAGELHDLARRLGAQLDNKARHLEILIQLADERIAALSAGSAAAPGPPPPPAAATPESSRGPAPPRTRPARELDPLTRAVYEHADAGLSAVQIARHLDEQVGKVELILALREA